MKNTLLATTCLAVLGLMAAAREADAANGAWTQVDSNGAAREKIYAISGTTDMQLPPLTPDKKKSSVEYVVNIASSSVIVTPTQVLISSSAPINNPSGTVPGAPTLRASAGAGATGGLISTALNAPKVGANVDVSDTGALWTIYAKVKAPATKSFANQ